MIRLLNKRSDKELINLVDFIKHNFDADFYLTKDNTRIYIQDKKELKSLFKETTDVYVHDDEGEYNGFILLWKAKSNDVTRHYVKILAKDAQIAKDLVTVLLWHHFEELYVKLNKRHPFLHVFKRLGFTFRGGRGKQLLLFKPKSKNEVKGKTYGHNSNNNHRPNKVYHRRHAN